MEKWDKYTVWDRFVEVRDQLNQEEQGILLSLLLHISGGYLENSGFWDMIRSQALVGHDYANFNHVWLLYKLREGQSNLARHMFEEAFDAGLEYSFHTKVTSITQTPSGVVEVTTSSGKTLKARRAICTVPLNVLKDLTFEPPLSNIRQEAITQGHICFLTKIHADVKEKGLASWNGIRYPANLVYGYGDCVEPSGNAHLVTFGSNKGDDFVPELHPEKVVEALRSLHPMTVERTVSHLRHLVTLHGNANLRRFFTIGTPILSHKADRASGVLSTCLNTKMNYRVGMEICCLHQQTGPMAGGRSLMAHLSRERRRRKLLPGS